MKFRAPVAAMAVSVACALAGCGADDVEAAAPETSASSAARTSAPATDAAPLHPDGGARPDDWPAEAAPVHGSTVWAVYLAVGPAGDPELAEATEYLESHGYSTGIGELGCDDGAAEALGRESHELAVAAYFDRRADAGDFVAMLKPPGSTPETSRGFVEMLRVTRYCLD